MVRTLHFFYESWVEQDQLCNLAAHLVLEGIGIAQSSVQNQRFPEFKRGGPVVGLAGDQVIQRVLTGWVDLGQAVFLCLAEQLERHLGAALRQHLEAGKQRGHFQGVFEVDGGASLGRQPGTQNISPDGKLNDVTFTVGKEELERAKLAIESVKDILKYAEIKINVDDII